MYKKTRIDIFKYLVVNAPIIVDFTNILEAAFAAIFWRQKVSCTKKLLINVSEIDTCSIQKPKRFSEGYVNQTFIFQTFKANLHEKVL